MALFKIFKGNDKNNLDAKPLNDGYAYYNTDTRRFYIDAFYPPMPEQEDKIKNYTGSKTGIVNYNGLTIDYTNPNNPLILDRRPINDDAITSVSVGYKEDITTNEKILGYKLTHVNENQGFIPAAFPTMDGANGITIEKTIPENDNELENLTIGLNLSEAINELEKSDENLSRNDYIIAEDGNELSGDIVTFEADEELPLKKLVVDIEPVQDLHGYDHPWSAGGGKNKFALPNGTIAYNGMTLKWQDGVFSIYAPTATSGEVSSDNPAWKGFGYCTLPAGSYTFYTERPTISGSFTIYLLNYDTGDRIVSDKSTGAFTFTLANPTNVYLGFYMFQAKCTTESEWKIGIFLSNEYTSYSPYFNVCPISGLTGVNINQIGLPPGYQAVDYVTVRSAIRVSTDLNFNASTSNGLTVISTFKAVTYRQYTPVYTVYYGENYNATRIIYNNSINSFLINNSSKASAPSHFTAAASKWHTVINGYREYTLDGIKYTYSASSGSTNPSNTFVIGAGNSAFNIRGIVVKDWLTLGGEYRLCFIPCINDSGIAGFWEAINGKFYTTDDPANISASGKPTKIDYLYSTTIPVTFTDPDSSDSITVYGGTLTLNPDGSADVISTMGNIASYAGEALPGAWISSMDVYAEGATPTTGAQVVYELEEPVSYHLDDVGQLKTFFGINTIWADTGNITVTYSNNTSTYKRKKLDSIFSTLNSTDIINALGYIPIDKSGDTMTGPLILNGNPTDNSHAATKEYVDNILTINDALVFKGVLGSEADMISSLPPNDVDLAYEQGWVYKVGTAGTYAGKNCEVGDTIYCIAGGNTINNNNWVILQTNIDGTVFGPSESASGIAVFTGTTGKAIRDSEKKFTTTTSSFETSYDDNTIPTTEAVYNTIKDHIADRTKAAYLNNIASITGSVAYYSDTSGTFASDENLNWDSEKQIFTAAKLNGYVIAGQKAGSTLGEKATAEGIDTIASGTAAHTEGQMSQASGTASHAEGYYTTASGSYSHAEGQRSHASGLYSHAEGQLTRATGMASHAEGYSTTASGSYSHAEGYSTTASGLYSHAEGSATIASGSYSRSEGQLTRATATASHAEGYYTTASGSYSHAEGYYMIANHAYQHVFGEFNIADSSTSAATARGNYIEIVGNGTSNTTRSNARTLDWNGNEILAGGLTIGTTATNDMDVPPLTQVKEIATFNVTSTNGITVNEDSITNENDLTIGLNLSEAINELEKSDENLSRNDYIIAEDGNELSGEIVTFETDEELPLKKLVVDIEPVQDLHGYDHPWPAGGGKNLLNIYGDYIVRSEITGTYTIQDESVNVKTSMSAYAYCGFIVPVTVGNTYTLSYSASSNNKVRIFQLDTPITTITNQYGTEYASGSSITAAKPYFLVNFISSSNVTYTKPQLELGSTATSYAPYKNICPITGWTGCNIVVSPTTDAQDGTTYSITFPTEAGTVYGGTLTINADGSGELASDYVVAQYPNTTFRDYYGFRCLRFEFSEAIMTPVTSSKFKYITTISEQANFTYKRTSYGVLYVFFDASYTDEEIMQIYTGTQFMFRRYNPVKYTLTAEQVGAILHTLYGTNNIWADCGDITVTYSNDTSTYKRKKLDSIFSTLNKNDILKALNLNTTVNAIAKYSDTSGTFADSGVLIDGNNNLIPNIPNSQNLGSTSKTWKNLYLNTYGATQGLFFIDNSTNKKGSITHGSNLTINTNGEISLRPNMADITTPATTQSKVTITNTATSIQTEGTLILQKNSESTKSVSLIFDETINALNFVFA